MRSDEILNTDWTKVDRKIRDSIRKKGKVTGGQARYEAYRIAFLKWIEKRTDTFLGYSGLAQKLMLDYDVDELAAEAVERAIVSTEWDDKSEPTAKKVFTEEALASYLLNISIPEASATSTELCSLAAQLLDIKPGESVVDLGCGVGSFLSEVSLGDFEANLFGYDVDEEAVAFCQMKTTVANSLSEGKEIRKPYEVRAASMFDEDAHRIKFDKAFSNYPLGVMIKDLEIGSKLLAQIKQELEGLRPSHHADWIFNRMLVESIKEGGRAVGVMTAGAAFRNEFSAVRETFVSNGWVEGVIALPKASLSRTRVPVVLIVLSFGNTSAKFVDASHLEVLDKSAVDAILAAWKEPSDGDELSLPAKAATKDDMERRGFTLYPMEYIRPLASGDSLEKLSRGRIRRGLDLEVDLDIERISQSREHDLGYVGLRPGDERPLLLTSAHLADGRAQLPLCAARDERKGGWGEQSYLQPGDLIVSRVSFDRGTKVAVADDFEGYNVVADAELLIVTLDQTLVDPWYAAAYLDSRSGQESLRRASSGALMRSLSLDALSKVEIPIVDLEEQSRIGGLWQERQDRIAMMRREILEAEFRKHEGLWD